MKVVVSEEGIVGRLLTTVMNLLTELFDSLTFILKKSQRNAIIVAVMACPTQEKGRRHFSGKKSQSWCQCKPWSCRGTSASLASAES